MKYPVLLGACCGALMSCGSTDAPRSFVPSPDRYAGSGEVDALPTGTQRYSEEVGSIAYDPSTEVLTISGDPFDLAGNFVRAPDRDVRGFAAFRNEGGARNYTALVRTDTVNQLAAGVVGTPIRLDNEFGGTVLARGAVPDLPVNREIRHTGDYAAVRNVGTNVGADMSNSFLHRVEGQVQLDLDFFDDRPTPGVEGVITNRRNMDGTTTREVEVEVEVRVPVPGGTPGLTRLETRTETRLITEEITYDDIVLQFTGIDAEGNFTGTAATGGATGLYDGMIGGPNAAASAGIVVIGNERGAFIARTQD